MNLFLFVGRKLFMVVAAVLIDGAYFVKRFRAIEPHNAYNGKRAAELAWRYALMHLSEKNGKSQLYRIFFYDCPPVEKKMHLPFSRTAVDQNARQAPYF